VVFAPEALAQLRWLRRHSASDARRVEDTVAARLSHEAAREDRNRKPMAPMTDQEQHEHEEVSWELRVQPYRVYYAVNEALGRVTVIGFFRKPRETATPLPQE
jgi:mRNA-degrading endonuclease RelE of RelBE toxin-antitoxin system